MREGRPMPFKLVVWDFDGTLADSLPSAVNIFNRLAPEMGFKPLTDVAAARGTPMRQFLRQQGISLWRLPRLVRKYQAAAAEEADKLKLATGLPAALTAIAAGGAKLGVLSSNREDNIRRCLRANGAEGHFAFVVGYPRLFGKGKALKRIIRRWQAASSWQSRALTRSLRFGLATARASSGTRHSSARSRAPWRAAR